MFRKILGLTLLITGGSAAAIGADLSLEPCIDGGVSASGNFPTQEMEEQIYAYRSWASEMPGYLFAMAIETLAPSPDDASSTPEVQ